MIFALAPWKTLLVRVLDFQSRPAIQFSKSITQLQSGLCKHYEKTGFFELNLEPWQKKPKYADIGANYIKQSVQTSDGFTTENLFDLFSWTEENTERFLLVADHGEGKTAIIKQATFEWCNTVLRDEYQWFQKLN